MKSQVQLLLFCLFVASANACVMPGGALGELFGRSGNFPNSFSRLIKHFFYPNSTLKNGGARSLELEGMEGVDQESLQKMCMDPHYMSLCQQWEVPTPM